MCSQQVNENKDIVQNTVINSSNYSIIINYNSIDNFGDACPARNPDIYCGFRVSEPVYIVK